MARDEASIIKCRTDKARDGLNYFGILLTMNHLTKLETLMMSCQKPDYKPS